MGLFDSLMEGANAFAERSQIKDNDNIFAKIGRIPRIALGMAPVKPFTKAPTPEEPMPVEEVEEQLPVDYLPPAPQRVIPDDMQLLGEELQGQFPEDSEISQIIAKGYKLVADPLSGDILGVGTDTGHLLSPKEALLQKPLPILLQENGFRPTSENIDRLVRQNEDLSLEPINLNFNGLQTLSDKVIVKSPMEVVMDTVAQTPIMQVFTGMKTPLSILGEGFSRYEALKTSALMDLGFLGMGGKNAREAITGEARSQFPDAALRGSKMPELGDIFRKMGMPEIASAFGGLTLDILTDAGIGAVGGKYLKQALKAMKFGEEDGLQLLTRKWHAFRANENVKRVIDAVKGKRINDIADAPEFVLMERTIRGKKNLASFDAFQSINEFSRNFLKQAEQSLGTDVAPDVLAQHKKFSEIANEVIHDRDLLQTGAGLPQEYLRPIQQWRSATDAGMRDLAGQYQTALASFPQEVQERLAKQASYKEGREISIVDLPKVLAKRDGEYVTLAYEIWQPNWKKPIGEKYDNALNGLIQEYDYTAKEATDILEELAEKKTLHLPERKRLNYKELSVHKGSFVARKQIPSYIREFMGEIKDPIYNMKNTTHTVQDALQKMKTFNMMHEAGMVSDKFVKDKFTTLIPEDYLAWGSLAGRYVSPDTHAFLSTLQMERDGFESAYLQAMKFVKAMKTTMNPPGHVRQSMQNIFTTILNGVSLFNPKNWPIYFGKDGVRGIVTEAIRAKQGLKPLVEANYQLYRKMIEDTLVGVELPWEELGSHLAKLELDPKMNTPLKGSAGYYLAKLSEGVKNVGKISSEAWAMEDIIPKMAAYLKKTRAGMSGKDAVNEIYKFTPNYAEASSLAHYVRNSPLAMTLATPFFTFKTEAHRIMLNIIKEGTMEQRLWLAGLMGGRAAFNIGMLTLAGNGLKDIKEFMMSKPEHISEVLLNPLAMESGEFDINTRYIDPFNPTGLWAPLLAYSGATKVNPLDYMLDFTNFSPEFGYGSLIPDSMDELLTGVDKFGNELSMKDRIVSLINGVGPSALPNAEKMMNPELDAQERLRRAFKLVGIDFEKRNPTWIRNKVKSRLEQKIVRGEDPTATLKAIDTIGFDSQKMLKNIERKLNKGKPLPKKDEDDDVKAVLDSFGF